MESYKIIYTVSSASLIIEIIRVGHRKDIYNRQSNLQAVANLKK
jgi:mRNA-degrading endonuclease RelE of RelBE toxin-antitoxin system